ncbi:phosphoribosyltransferase [Streptomyces sp. 11-1-2]|nr:phosphoribosyltransferase [Streptomyces sp. 11-1-2]
MSVGNVWSGQWVADRLGVRLDGGWGAEVRRDGEGSRGSEVRRDGEESRGGEVRRDGEALREGEAPRDGGGRGGDGRDGEGASGQGGEGASGGGGVSGRGDGGQGGDGVSGRNGAGGQGGKGVSSVGGVRGQGGECVSGVGGVSGRGGDGGAELRELLGLALRRNPKRAHLLVSNVLGKHVPQRPAIVHDAGVRLGRRVRELLGDEAAARAVVLGYAETATGLGHSVADGLALAPYLHSTRRPVPGVATVGGFEEEHSHATSHLLLPEDPGLLASTGPLVLVDDEFSTGRTVLNTIAALHRRFPRDHYVVVALVDMRSPEDRARLDAFAADLGARVDLVAAAAGAVHLPDDVLERGAKLVAAHEEAAPDHEAAPAPTAPPAGAAPTASPAGAASTVPSAGAAPDAGPAVVRVDLGWPEALPDGGRHGFTPAHRVRLEAALPTMATRLANALAEAPNLANALPKAPDDPTPPAGDHSTPPADGTPAAPGGYAAPDHPAPSGGGAPASPGGHTAPDAPADDIAAPADNPAAAPRRTAPAPGAPAAPPAPGGGGAGATDRPRPPRPSSRRVLVLGFEELMYAPLRIAKALDDVLDGVEVRYSTTTRSPVLAVDDPGYAIRTRLTFPAHDEPADGPGPRYAYNVAPGADPDRRFDAVVAVVDSTADTPALHAPGGLLAALSTHTDRLVLAVVPSYRPQNPPTPRTVPERQAPPMHQPSYEPLRGPDFSSYAPEEVGWLLQDFSHVTLEAPTEEREEAIQSGGAHYAESLPVEYQPNERYQDLFRAALDASAARIARAVGAVTETVLAERSPRPVLVSLARAGTPVGVLMRRWAHHAHGLDLPHYAVSIVRGRGIDTAALRWLADHHDPSDVVFVDGWTGKGAITRELSDALAPYPDFDPRIAVLADPGRCVDTYGTRDDFLVPSACLNSTVSGLISRTVLRADLVGPNDFHGAKYYRELAGSDASGYFLDTVSGRFAEVAEAAMADARQLAATDRSPTWEGWAAVERISQEYGIHDVNLVKPGVGETTRVLLRRVPWKILAQRGAGADLDHVRLLAEQRGVPVEEIDGLPYTCVGLIHPRYTRGATGADGKTVTTAGTTDEANTAGIANRDERTVAAR